MDLSEDLFTILIPNVNEHIGASEICLGFFEYLAVPMFESRVEAAPTDAERGGFDQGGDQTVIELEPLVFECGLDEGKVVART